MIQQLAYPKFENEDKKIPDLTIGLHTYDLQRWDDNQNDALLPDGRVQMFDQNLLRRLENAGYLPTPFLKPGSHGRRVADMSLAFPFAFWEAKRAGGGYDHLAAKKQNALKIKMILKWQDEIAKAAKVPWLPLAWYFISVGAEWEIYGCYFQQKRSAPEGRICVSVSLPY